MSKSLLQRIKELEEQMLELSEIIKNKTEELEKYKKPHSSHGSAHQYQGNVVRTKIMPFTGPILPFNDNDLDFEEENTSPPTVGYNQHTHSEFSGGALDIETVEFIEYDWKNAKDNQNKHSPGNWRKVPPIKTVFNKDKTSTIEKRGALDLEFDPETKKWQAKASVVDIENTMFVKYDEEGNIETDDNGNKKIAALYNANPIKSSIVWDKNHKVWRLHAVFSDWEQPEEGEE